ncbi:MAG: ADP-ribosyltransferase [Candidatus Auribacterota bacterium]|nr:ADP-ribosyltransferase [Candidatus Auribacterota bacterium]
MPRQPIHGHVDEFNAAYLKLSNGLIKQIQANIATGMLPRKAINQAWISSGFTAELTDEMLDGIALSTVDGAITGLSNLDEFKDFYLNDYYDPQGLNLSQKIHKNTKKMRQIQSATIRTQLKNNAAWGKLAKEFDVATKPAADIASHIDNLVAKSKKILPDDKKALRELKTALNRSKREVSRLAAAGAPTKRLKKAYQNVINKVEDGQIDGLDKAMARAVKAKSRYNAERLARTEMANAYGEGFKYRLGQDEDATGYKVSLSSRHPKYDICDFHTKADLHGGGPGAYPKGKGPRYSFHPHCSCVLRPWYKFIANIDVDDKSAQRFLEKASKPEQNNLFGVAGAEKFRKNPKSWKKHLNQYGSEVSQQSGFPQKHFKPYKKGSVVKPVGPAGYSDIKKANTVNEKWAYKKLSADEFQAINGYSKKDYIGINAQLRASSLEMEFVNKATKTQVGLIDAGLKKTSAVYSGTVYRGMVFPTKKDFNSFIRKSKPGKEICYKQYWSTSAKRNQGVGFSQPSSIKPHSVFVKMKSKTGVPLGPAAFIGAENEVLFRREIQWKVKSRKKVKLSRNEYVGGKLKTIEWDSIEIELEEI